MSKTQYIYQEDKTPKEVYGAVDFMISNSSTASLIKGLMDDYTPKTANTKPGLSFSSVFKTIGFAISHPVHTFNLINFARSGGYLSPAFQERMIQNPAIQNVISTNAGKLEQVGQILRDNTAFGKDLFSETGPLNSRALKTLSQTFTDKNSMSAIQSIAIKAIAPVKDVAMKEAQYKTIASDPKIKEALAKRGIDGTFQISITKKDLLNIRSSITSPDLKAIEIVIQKTSPSATVKLSKEECAKLSQNTQVMNTLKASGITELTPSIELKYDQLEAMKVALQTESVRALDNILGGATDLKATDPISVKRAQYQSLSDNPEVKTQLTKLGITALATSSISQKDLLAIKEELTPQDLKEMTVVISKASLSSPNKLSAEQCALFTKNPNVMARLSKFGITALTSDTELSYKQLDAMKFAMQTPELTNLGYIAGGATTAKTMDIMSDVCKLWTNDKGLRQTLEQNGQAIQAYLEKEAEHDPIKGYLSLYGIDKSMLKQVPQILTQPEISSVVIDSFAKRDPFMKTVEKFLDAVKDKEGFKEFARANPQLLNDASIGYLNSSEDWKVWTDSIGLNSGVLNAVGAILSAPKIAHQIMKTYNEGKGFDLAEIMLEAINNPEHPLLGKLQELARDGSYTKLVTDILASSPSMEEGLVSYGVTKEQIPQLVKITEILLDKPQELKKVYELFKKQDYVELSATLLELTKTTPALKTYFDTNTELMQTVATKALEKQTAAISSYVDTSKVSQHVPEVVQSLLKAVKNPSAALIEGIRTSDYTKITGEVIDLLCDKDVGLTKSIQGLAKAGVFNTLIQGMLDQNEPLKKQLKHLGITEKNLPKITQIFDILLDEPQKLKSVFNKITSKDYLGLAQEVLQMASDNPKISNYLYDNKQIIENVIKDTLQKNPEVKYWTQGTDLSKTTKSLVQTLAIDPERMVDMIEQYKTGSWTALATNLLRTIDVRDTAVAATSALQKRGGWLGAIAGATQYAASWVCTDTAKAERQTATNILLDELSSHQKSSVKNEYQILDGVNIGNPKGVALQLNNTKWSNVTMVNSIISNVNFAGSELSNCSFLGAQIDSKTRFDGATIDAATLRSLADIRTNNGKPINLDNVKIIGDISNIDLTRLSLENADFRGVTAANGMKGANDETLRNIDIAVTAQKRQATPEPSTPKTTVTTPNPSFARQNTEPHLVEAHVAEAERVRQNIEKFVVEDSTHKPTQPKSTSLDRRR